MYKRQVWVITGDGDALSIGGNHLIHVLRRNLDLNIVMFNNEIYGLTKGQYSPTSKFGQKTKSSPFGSIDMPFNTPSVVLGAKATFFARTIDSQPKHLQYTLRRSQEHIGSSFIEVFQNCIIFNDKAFSHVTDRDVRDDNVIDLKNGEPMIFGKNQDKGIKLDGFSPEVVSIKDNVSTDDLLIHDEKNRNLASILANFTENESLPTPIGVFYSEEKPRYEELLEEQLKESIKNMGNGDLNKLIAGSDSWKVS